MKFTAVYVSLTHGFAAKRACWPDGKYIMYAHGGTFRTVDGQDSNQGNLGPMLVRRDPHHEHWMPHTLSQQEMFATDWRAMDVPKAKYVNDVRIGTTPREAYDEPKAETRDEEDERLQQRDGEKAEAYMQQRGDKEPPINPAGGGEDLND